MHSDKILRVVSLLPSATEIFSSIINESKSLYPQSTNFPKLVGKSHECDRPLDIIQDAQILTSAKTQFTTSKDVDKQVSKALNESNSLYNLDIHLLKSLKPDIILTQDICNVCAIDLMTVNQAVEGMTHPVEIVCLNPLTFKHVVYDQILKVGKALKMEVEATNLIEKWMKQIALIQSQNTFEKQPKVLFLEWLNPPYIGGHWTPELIHMAGGIHPWNPPFKNTNINENTKLFPYNGSNKSIAIHPSQIQKYNPDIVIVAPCGFDLKMTEEQLEYEIQSIDGTWWDELKAVKENKVVLVDGNAMFNRPGPTLIDSLDWLHALIGDQLWNINSKESKKFHQYPYKLWKSIDKDNDTSLQKDKIDYEIEELHQIACQQKDSMYVDPITGFSVLTEFYLKNRKKCCGNGCRHCPYGHANVKNSFERKNRIQKCVALNPINPKIPCHMIKHTSPRILEKASITVIFWSGGKDSFLALYEYIQHHKEINKEFLVLLTTFDPKTGRIPVQEIDIIDVIAQANYLNLPIVVIPISNEKHSYTPTIQEKILELPNLFQNLHKEGLGKVEKLVFGDIFLEDVRKWKEDQFQDLNCELLFPLWKRNEEKDLIPKLNIALNEINGKVFFSAIESPQMKEIGWNVGDIYPMDGKNIPFEVDRMGENGEFHTRVEFKGSSIGI